MTVRQRAGEKADVGGGISGVEAGDEHRGAERRGEPGGRVLEGDAGWRGPGRVEGERVSPRGDARGKLEHHQGGSGENHVRGMERARGWASPGIQSVPSLGRADLGTGGRQVRCGSG